MSTGDEKKLSEQQRSCQNTSLLSAAMQAPRNEWVTEHLPEKWTIAPARRGVRRQIIAV